MINVVVAAETKTSPCKWQRWGFTLTLGLVFKHSKRYTMDRSQIDVEQMKQCQVLVLAHFEKYNRFRSNRASESKSKTML